jgi:hypothetical protein
MEDDDHKIRDEGRRVVPVSQRVTRAVVQKLPGQSGFRCKVVDSPWEDKN